MTSSCQPIAPNNPALLLAEEILPEGETGVLRLGSDYWIVSKPYPGHSTCKKIDLDEEIPYPSLAFRLDRIVCSAAKMQKGEFLSRSKYGSPSYHWLICREADGTYRSVYYGSKKTALKQQQLLAEQDSLTTTHLYATDPKEATPEQHRAFREEFRNHWLFLSEKEYALGSNFVVYRCKGKVTVRFLQNPGEHRMEDYEFYNMEQMRQIQELIPSGYWGRLDRGETSIGIGKDDHGNLQKFIDPFANIGLEEIPIDLQVLIQVAKGLGAKQIYSEINTLSSQHLLMYREGQELRIKIFKDNTFSLGFEHQNKLLSQGFWLYVSSSKCKLSQWEEGPLARLGQIGDWLGPKQYFQDNEILYVKDNDGKVERAYPSPYEPNEYPQMGYSECKESSGYLNKQTKVTIQ